jgi:hypothetical protein
MVPHQGPAEQLAAAGLHPSLRDRVHSRHLDPAEHDLDPGVLEYGVEQARKLAIAVQDQEPRPAAASSRSMTRFFAAWATQKAVGCGVAPRIRIRRLACSMTASTYRRAPVKVTVSKKSQASRASAWERRNLAQAVEVRSGGVPGDPGASAAPSPAAPAAETGQAYPVGARAAGRPGTPGRRGRTAAGSYLVVAPGPRSGDVAPGSPRPWPGRSPEAAAVPRTRSSHRDRQVEAAQPIIMPQRAGPSGSNQLIRQPTSAYSYSHLGG